MLLMCFGSICPSEVIILNIIYIHSVLKLLSIMVFFFLTCIFNACTRENTVESEDMLFGKSNNMQMTKGEGISIPTVNLSSKKDDRIKPYQIRLHVQQCHGGCPGIEIYVDDSMIYKEELKLSDSPQIVAIDGKMNKTTLEIIVECHINGNKITKKEKLTGNVVNVYMECLKSSIEVNIDMFDEIIPDITL